MILKILPENDPIMNANCDPVPALNEELEDLIKDMYETMLDAKGIGLAAPQVGIAIRLFVMKKPNMDSFEAYINPEILVRSPEHVSSVEGCLSFNEKDLYAVDRHAYVIVKYKDINSKVQIKPLYGLEAICFQHELDHLNGINMDDKGYLWTKKQEKS